MKGEGEAGVARGGELVSEGGGGVAVIGGVT